MKKNKAVMISLIVALFLSFGFLYIGWSKYQQSVKTDLSQISKTVPADWRTYRDEKNGFEFKYPQNWIFTNDNDKFVVLNKKSPFDGYLDIKSQDYTINSGAEFLLTSGVQTTSQGTMIPIKDCKGLPGLKLVDCPDKIDGSISLMKVDNIIALVGEANNVTGVIFTKNGSTYSLHFLRAKDFQDKDKIFFQILSTFKFTK